MFLRLSPRILISVTGIILLTAFGITLEKFCHQQFEIDPDRDYHFAISRLYAEGGIPDKVPQVEDLGWGKNFPEKEFLFHVLTGLGYKIAGTTGVSVVCLALAISIYLSILIVNASILQSWFVLPLTIIPLVFAEPFFQRAFLIRPQALAILIFVWILFSAIKRSPIGLFITFLLFPLAYHAITIPIAVLGIGFVVAKYVRIDFFRPALAGILGLTAGSVLNPFFPMNLMMGVQHSLIALQQIPIPVSYFGTELIPLRSDYFIKMYPSALIFVFLFFFFTNNRNLLTRMSSDQDQENRFRVLFPFIVFSFFLFLIAINPRAVEYMTPALVISTTCLWCYTTSHKSLLLFTIILSSILQVFWIKIVYDNFSVASENSTIHHTNAAIDSLPASSLGRKIFNCEWSTSPQILQRRPDLRFVDLLDPSFLYAKDQAKFEAMANLRNGMMPDPYALIKNDFHADYALCMSPNAVSLLRGDPNFLQIYPPVGTTINSPVFLFEVAPKRLVEYVQEYQTEVQTFLNENVTVSTNPSHFKKLKAYTGDFDKKNPGKSVFVDLFKEIKDLWTEKNLKDLRASPTSAFVCGLIEPSNAEIDRSNGDTILGIGGGPYLNVFLNDKPIFHNQIIQTNPKLINYIVQLPSPLIARDRISVIVCGPAKGRYLGAAISFWQAKAMLKLCANRSKVTVRNQSLEWTTSDLSPIGCLGSLSLAERVTLEN